MNNLSIITGDTVIVRTGKDAGKKGRVMQTFPRVAKVVVEGVHIIKKHIKPKSTKEKGQRIELAAPIAVSNVQLLCSKCNKGVRIKIVRLSEGFERHCKKCDFVFPHAQKK